MLDVIEVVLDLFSGLVDVGRVALAHLRPAGDTGFDHVPVAVEGEFLVEVSDEVGLLGAGSDQAHVAFQDVHELRQFIDAVFAQHSAHSCNAGVVLACELIRRFFVEAHASYLVDLEGLVAPANTCLGVYGRAWTLQPHNYDGDQRQR